MKMETKKYVGIYAMLYILFLILAMISVFIFNDWERGVFCYIGFGISLFFFSKGYD